MKIFHICIGQNMYFDEYCDIPLGDVDRIYRDKLYFDIEVFREVTAKLPAFGFDTVMIELAEGMEYKCAPELKVEGTISREEIKKEIRTLKNLGLKVIPKLDFSATHDIWLKDYSRMVSTDIYRKKCEELICEVCDIFESPEYFHIGMGDECNEKQQHYGYIVTRGPVDFWLDAYTFFDACRKNNATPIMSAESFVRDDKVFLHYLPEDTVLDVHFAGVFVPEKDFFGRDARGEDQKILQQVFSVKNRIIASGGLAGWNNEAKTYFDFAKGMPNVIGLMASPEVATVKRNKFLLLREIDRMQDAMK